MGAVYTTGSWRPFEGQEAAEFLGRWREFAEWAAALPERCSRATSATQSGS